jgi:hypothetical protein
MLVHLADALIARLGLQHDAFVRGGTYALCVVLAGVSGPVLRRTGAGDRIDRWTVAAVGAVGAVGIVLAAVFPPTGLDVAPLAAVGLVVLACLAGETGYRLDPSHRSAGRGGAAPAVPAEQALTSVAEIHAARTHLVAAFVALDRAVAAGERATDETARILRAELDGIAEETAAYRARLERLKRTRDAPARRRNRRPRRGRPGRQGRQAAAFPIGRG